MSDTVTSRTEARQASLSSTVSCLLKFMSIELVMLSNHLILCCPLLLLPSIFPSIMVLEVLGSTGASVSASVLPMNIQGWFSLGLTSLISLLSKRPSKVFSSTTGWKYQIFSTQLSLWSNSHIHTWLLEKPQLWLDGPLSAKRCLCFLTPCLGLS